MNILGLRFGIASGRVVGFASLALLLASPAFAKPPAPATAPVSCESLSSIKLPDTTITLAETIAAGAYTPPPPAARGGGRGGAPAGAPAAGGPAGGAQGAPAGAARGGRGGAPAVSYADLPAFCRVQATVRPSSDSEINIEIWMPATGWNNKFEAVGNGGYAGAIAPAALVAALRKGYASGTTDTGHTGGNADFMQGHPEKRIDFGYRAIHEMTVKGQALVAAFYGDKAKYSYFNGCSTGGRQALQEAQRFPNDFDGIIAGAAANFTTHMTAQQLWVGQAVHMDESTYISADKYKVLHQAVLDACDTLDGVKDGVLENPMRCKSFDPKVVECKGADGPTCLTAAQVEAVRKIYNGPNPPYTKTSIFPGLEPGSENGWATGLAAPNAFGYAVDNWKYVILQDPNFDFKTLNFDTDVAKAEKIDPNIVTANDPNLAPFFAHGGKLLQYHGWSDPLIAPENSVNYHNRVLATVGANKVKDSYRLFMVPGAAHCGGGDGPTDNLGVLMLSAMEQWRESNKVPDQIIATKIINNPDGTTTNRTRPLCPYPQMATYKGSGNTDDAANFVCKAP